MEHGAVSFVYAVSEAAVPYPRWAGTLNGGRFTHVFHQVRKPLATIASRAASPQSRNGSTWMSSHITLPPLSGTFRHRVASLALARDTLPVRNKVSYPG